MRYDFAGIGDLVKVGLEKLGLQGAVRENSAMEVWAEVVGEKTASVTRPERVRDGVMFVTCRDSVWAQELHFLRPMIVKRINEKLAAKVIKEIRLSGVGFRKGDKREEEGPAPPKEIVMPCLDDAETAEIEAAAANIEDPELAERVRRGLRASRAFKKSME